jgi:hypothetical protein
VFDPGLFRKDSSKVLDVEHEQMIRALAPDRADQAFNMPILPGRTVPTWAGPGSPLLVENRWIKIKLRDRYTYELTEAGLAAGLGAGLPRR